MTETGPALLHSALAAQFERFASEAVEYASPLYASLSRQIASDPEILALAARVRRPPAANLLLATVHFLLAEHRDHPLASYYASFRRDPLPPDEAYPHFRNFLLECASDAIPLLETRITQTNEVSRCSYLLPSFTTVYRQHGERPLALVDVGCSAGLHLLWDRFRYDYGSIQVGNEGSPLTIRCRLIGELPPPLPSRMPECSFRCGIDLHPIDLGDAIERKWFEALIWPEHESRRVAAAAAIRELLANPPHLVTGNAVDVLPGQLLDVPASSTLVVYNSHALCQGGQPEVDALKDILASFSSRGPVTWLFCEGYEVIQRDMKDGVMTERKLANKDGHGRWLEWLDRVS